MKRLSFLEALTAIIISLLLGGSWIMESVIRTNSAERDVRASELIHAWVLAVHEVRPFLDLSHVPPRGKWGSATAAGLPVALKDAFQSAIARSRPRY